MDSAAELQRMLGELEQADRAVAIAIEARATLVVECYAAGATVAQLARLLGVGRPTVYRIIDAHIGGSRGTN